MVIQPDTLWGLEATPALGLPAEFSVAPALLPVSTEPVPAPPPVDLGSGGAQQNNFLSPDQIQQIIVTAVQQSLVSQFMPANRAASVQSGASTSWVEVAEDDALSIEALDSPISSISSRTSSQAEEDPPDFDLSEDEGLPLDQPTFMGLFLQALFKSLLHKAVTTAQLGSPSPPSAPLTAAQGTLNPLFAEPSRPMDYILTPPLFLNIIRKQWSSPGSASAPTATDCRNFNMAQDLAAILQIPTMDEPVATLLLQMAIPGDFHLAEHHAEQVLQWEHLGMAWVIWSASTASFNQTTLLWLRHLQETLVTEDVWVRQDLNKIIAATQFPADAALNAARFAAKSLASSVSACHLVWLRHWQADTWHMWHLTLVTFTGSKLFGEPLEAFLTETKDKKKILPVVFRRGESRFHPYLSHPSLGLMRVLTLPLLQSGNRVIFNLDTGALRIGWPEVGNFCPNGSFEWEGVIPSCTIINCIPDPPMGDRLALFAHFWERSTSDEWVLATL